MISNIFSKKKFLLWSSAFLPHGAALFLLIDFGFMITRIHSAEVAETEAGSAENAYFLPKIAEMTETDIKLFGILFH